MNDKLTLGLLTSPSIPSLASKICPGGCINVYLGKTFMTTFQNVQRQISLAKEIANIILFIISSEIFLFLSILQCALLGGKQNPLLTAGPAT